MEIKSDGYLFELAALVAKEDKLENILDFILTTFKDLTGSPKLAVDLIAHDGMIDLQRTRGLSKRSLNWQMDAGVSGWVVANRQVLSISNVRQDERYRSARHGVRSELAAPLLFQNTLLGVINLESSKPGAFEVAHEQLLLAMAPFLAACVENQRLVNAQLERQSEQLKSLVEIGQAIAAVTQEPEEILKQIVDSANRLLGADISVLYRFDARTHKFLPNPTVSGQLLQGRLVVKSAPREADGMAARVRDEEVVVIENLQTDPQRENSFTRAEQIKSFIGVALKAGGDFIGVLYVNFRKPHHFLEHEQFVIHAFAEQAAIAVRKARLLEQLAILNDISQRLNRAVHEDDFFLTVYQEVGRLLNTELFLIARYHESTQTMDLWTVERGKEKYWEEQTLGGLSGWVIQNRRALLVHDADQKNLPARPLQLFINIDARPCSYLMTPLTVGDRVLGVVGLLSYESNMFHPEDEHLLSAIAAHVAVALDNQTHYQLQEQLLRVGQILTESHETTVVLEQIMRAARRELGAHLVYLYQYYADQDRFDPPGNLRSGELLDPGFPLAPKVRSDDIALLLVKRGQSHYTANARDDEVMSGPRELRRPDRFVIREHIVSSAGIVLRVQQQIVGVMFINYRTYQPFDQRQRNQIELFANYAAAAIARARLTQGIQDSLDRRLAELKALTEIDKKITTSSKEEVFAKILEAAMEITSNQGGRGHIFLIDGEYLNAPIALRGGGSKAGTFERDKIGNKGIISYVALKKEAVCIPDLATTGWWDDSYVQSYEDTRAELAVPMVDEKGELLGVINLESPRVGAFVEDDQRLLMALAEQGVIAYQNSRRFEAEHRARRQLEALAEIDKAISSTLDLDEVLQLIVDKGVELIPAPLFQVMLLDERQGDWFVAAEHSSYAEPRYGRQSLNVGIPGRVAQTSKSVRIDDVTASQWSKIYFSFTEGTHAELAAPMLRGERVVGVLNVESPEIGAFTADHEWLLNTLAGQTVIAVLNAELYQKERTSKELVEAMRKIEAAINRREPLEQIMTLMLQEAMRLTRADQGDFILYHADQEELESIVTVDRIGSVLIPRQGEQAHRLFKADMSITGHVAKTRQSYLSRGDIKHDINVPYFGEADIHSELAAPLLVDNRLAGVLNLESREIDWFTVDDQDMLQTFAEQAAAAMREAQDRDEIEKAKQRQQEAEYMEAIGVSAMEMAHRIGNSLGTVRAYIQKIRDLIGSTDSRINQGLDEILKSTQVAINLERRFKEALAIDRDLSREKELIPVLTLLLATRDAYPIPENVRVVLNYPDELPAIQADRRIYDALINLVMNAVQALPPRGGTIELGARVIDGEIEFWIKDDGPGIPKARQKQIFELFYSTKSVGMGFGLWSVKRTVLAHGGTIELESDIGRGATFKIRLPLRKLGSTAATAYPTSTVDRDGQKHVTDQLQEIIRPLSDDEHVSQKSPLQHQSLSKQPKIQNLEGRPGAAGRILIVEDDPSWQELLSSSLTARGYIVELAANINDAQQKMASSLFHLLISDLWLEPNSDEATGLHLLGKLAELDLLGGFEVIMLSALPTTDALRQAFKRYNVYDFIEKEAFDRDRFGEIVDEVFADRIKVNLHLAPEFAPTFHLDHVLDSFTSNILSMLPVQQQQIELELTDLLRRLFYESKKIVVHPSPSVNTKMFGLTIDAYDQTGPAGTFWVQIDSVAEIEKTYQAWQRVFDTKSDLMPSLLFNKSRTPLLGGIVYWPNYPLLIENAEQLDKIKREYHELALADRQKLMFIDVASHEFRRPLSDVHHVLEEALDNQYGRISNNKLRTHLNIAFERCLHLEHLVSQLLDVAQLQTGKVKLNLSTNNVVELIQKTIQHMDHKVKGKNLHLETQLPSTPLYIELDSVRIRQVFENLLDNAVKYNVQDGNILISCTAELDAATICVMDTGRGIPEDKLQQIFEVFYQVDSSPIDLSGDNFPLARPAQGLGVGLHLAKGYVELHHGRIYVQNNEDSGVTFFVILPFVQPA